MISFKHKRIITDTIIQKLEKIRDYINDFDEYKFEKYGSIVQMIQQFINIQYKPFEQIV